MILCHTDGQEEFLRNLAGQRYLLLPVFTRFVSYTCTLWLSPFLSSFFAFSLYMLVFHVK